jgi:hypothetical protein
VSAQVNDMPEISRFSGLVIVMVFLDKHQTPHIHAYYGGKGDRAEYAVSIAIRSLSTLAGRMPKRQLAQLITWMDHYEQALLQNWENAANGRPVRKIPPLRFT